MDSTTGRSRREQTWRRGGVIGPTLLVAGGVVFLLNSTGRLDWNVWWTLVRLWPVLLVAVGLDLLVGHRSVLGSLLVVAVIALAFAGGVWLHQNPTFAARALPAGEEIAQPRDGATAASITLAPANGSLRVQGGSSPANLLEGTLRQAGRPRVERTFAVEGGRAVFDLRGPGGDWWSPGPSPRAGAAPNWDLALAADLPTELIVHMGAGEAMLELTETAVTRVEVSQGLGASEVHLPAHGRVQARISGAIGQIVVVIPRGMEARISVSGGIAARDIAAEFARQGDQYVSAGYLGAADAVDMEISQAIGSIVVRRAPLGVASRPVTAWGRLRLLQLAVLALVLDLDRAVHEVEVLERLSRTALDGGCLLRRGACLDDEVGGEHVAGAIQRPDVRIMRRAHARDGRQPLQHLAHIHVLRDSLKEERQRLAQIPDHIDQHVQRDQHRKQRVEDADIAEEEYDAYHQHSRPAEHVLDQMPGDDPGAE